MRHWGTLTHSDDGHIVHVALDAHYNVCWTPLTESRSQQAKPSRKSSQSDHTETHHPLDARHSSAMACRARRRRSTTRRRGSTGRIACSVVQAHTKHLTLAPDLQDHQLQRLLLCIQICQVCRGNCLASGVEESFIGLQSLGCAVGGGCGIAESY